MAEELPSGFRLIDGQFDWLPIDGDLPEIIEIRFDASSEWSLHLRLEGIEGGPVWIAFEDPVSFRVHDERELHAYWMARSAEGVGVGRVYTIDHSVYLSEIRWGIALHERLTHYLVTGIDTCVEVLSTEPPIRLGQVEHTHP